MEDHPRRVFLGIAPALVATAWCRGQPEVAARVVGAAFPSHEPDVVREFVGVCHGKVERVRAMLGDVPQLANAALDWGFGDWETALGAASHVGNREIATLLIERGARPDIFTHAMMGHLAMVKGLVEAFPGIQRRHGPHGITLLAHARSGGDAARGVVEYLAALGDADLRYADEPLSEEERARLCGEYAFGASADERLSVFAREGGPLAVQRPGGAPRNIFHQGSCVFIPAGGADARLTFRVESGRATELRVTSPATMCEAKRV